MDLDTVLTFKTIVENQGGDSRLKIIIPQSNGSDNESVLSLQKTTNGWISRENGPFIPRPWSFRLREKPRWEKISQKSDYQVFLNDRGNGVLILIPDFNQNEFERPPAYADVRFYAKKVFGHFKDDFDFILSAFNYPAIPRGWGIQGVSYQVYNQVKGIGMDSVMAMGSYNDPSQFGSEGKLKRFIFFPKLSAIKNGPSLHEIMHSWGIFIKMFVDSSSVAADGPGHWGMSEVFGAMGGFKPGTFKAMSNGLYRADFGWTRTRNLGWNKSRSMNLVPFSDIELYLMGIVSIQDVKPFIYCSEAEWQSHPANGLFSARKVETIQPSEIVESYGEREPSWKDSQKDFRALAVLLATQIPTDAESLAFADSIAYFSSKEPPDEAPYNFYTATRGKASIRFDGLHTSLVDK